MPCDSEILELRRGGDTSPAESGKDPGPTLSGDVGDLRQPLAEEQLIPIFVCGAAHSTHVLRLQLSTPLADLSSAAQRFGHGLGADRLCFLGGAPLPHDERLTLAEAGLRANSSLQVVGRLLGGVQVTVFEQQHSLGEPGHLDLSEKDLGPAQARELAAFLASPESAAVRRLTLSGNPLTGGTRSTDFDMDLTGVTA
eukprot:COSAG02_NODE_18124_length_959_cov_1.481395_1_plen_196_part_10